MVIEYKAKQVNAVQEYNYMKTVESGYMKKVDSIGEMQMQLQEMMIYVKVTYCFWFCKKKKKKKKEKKEKEVRVSWRNN